MIQGTEVLRDDDPRCADMEAKGYVLIAESWGARLRLKPDQDLDLYRVATSLSGVTLEEMNVEFAEALLALELVNNADYPFTPATFHAVPTIDSVRALWKSESKTFGAYADGALVGAISTSRAGDIVELDFASVLSSYRGKGIGKALAALAVLVWFEEGARVFATGGASSNEASLGTVKSLGFSVEEKWRSYQLPM